MATRASCFRCIHLISASRSAAEAGRKITDYTAPFSEQILADARTLGILPVRSYPLATQYIPQMVAWVEKLEQKGLLDKTIIILTADHGEEFRDHGGIRHTDTLYDELIKVPLLIKIPGIKPARIKTAVALSDIVPTLFSLIELQIPGKVSGKIIRFGRGGVKAKERAIFAEANQGVRKRCVIKDSYKLILDLSDKKRELYNLAEDPKERVNLADISKGKADELARLITQYYDASELIQAPSADIDEQMLKKLNSLGYLNR